MLDFFLFYFVRTIDQAKYVPELAYYGLRLLCSPLHSLEDKVKITCFCDAVPLL